MTYGLETRFTNRSRLPLKIEPETPAKSMWAAYAWTLSGPGLIVAPGVIMGYDPLAYTLIVLGLVTGPSFGQYYAGSYRQGIWATSVRLLGTGMALPGYIRYVEDLNQTGASRHQSDFVSNMMVTGVLILETGIIYSWVDTYFAVKRANEKLKAQRFGFSPELFPSNDGGLKPGMLAWAKF